MKTLEDININEWFMNRRIRTPEHFVLSSVRHTREIELWIIEKLKGRYSVYIKTVASPSGVTRVDTYFAFEDPAEMLFCSLVWN